MTVDRYLQHKLRWEFAITALLLLISFAANVGVATMELQRTGAPFPAWLPVVLEGTSHAAFAALIPLILWFDGHFPIGRATWKTSLSAHALFSVVFSLLHVTLMYWGRVGIVRVLSPQQPYRWDDWPREFAYEYLKDFRTYILVLALVYLYRFILRRLQGEAGLVGADHDDQEQVSDRFLVKKLGREFLVRLDDVDWIEASGNYVNLHVGKRVYPLRDTMTNISRRLEPYGFQRVHRSAIINLDRISEIIAFDSGDAEARLTSQATVPVSRRFRKQLRERLARGATA